MREKSTITCWIATAIGIISCVVWLTAFEDRGSRTVAQEPGSSRAAKKPRTVEPAEGDMHEFMGYVCEPVYRRLKRSLATKPATEEAWKAVASDALLLAETGNLLLTRGPDATDDTWPSNATGLRTFGSFVYRAAREEDYQNAMFYYRHLVEQCNDCHRANGSGDRRLEP